jgi:hypothetical protein
MEQYTSIRRESPTTAMMHKEETTSERNKEIPYHLYARQDHDNIQARHWICESRKRSVWYTAAVQTQRAVLERLRRAFRH